MVQALASITGVTRSGLSGVALTDTDVVLGGSPRSWNNKTTAMAVTKKMPKSSNLAFPVMERQANIEQCRTVVFAQICVNLLDGYCWMKIFARRPVQGKNVDSRLWHATCPNNPRAVPQKLLHKKSYNSTKHDKVDFTAKWRGSPNRYANILNRFPSLLVRTTKSVSHLLYKPSMKDDECL